MAARSLRACGKGVGPGMAARPHSIDLINRLQDTSAILGLGLPLSLVGLQTGVAARCDPPGPGGPVVWLDSAGHPDETTGGRAGRSAPARRGTAQQPATSRVALRLCKLDHLLAPLQP